MGESTHHDGLVTVAEFVKRHPWCRRGGLRWALHHRATNGLEAAVVRFGRRILLDEAAVLVWMRTSGRTLAPTQVR